MYTIFNIHQRYSYGTAERLSMPFLLFFLILILSLSTVEVQAEKNDWGFNPNIQYHIQTDEGPERYFRFQTSNGQYRKEKRLRDGTVIGTDGWLDPLGYLRLKDYIADSKGYRILRSKMIYVGKHKPIHDAVAETKRQPSQSGVLLKPTKLPNPFRQPLADRGSPVLGNAINSDYYDAYNSRTKSRIDTSVPVSALNDRYSYDVNRENVYHNLLQPSNAASVPNYQNLKPNIQQSATASLSSPTNFPEYDGTYNVANGFQYYLKRQYHEDERDSTGANVGSFGYIDPFGIRRVVYYKTDPQTGGFHHQKNNKYVGFAATPYDPAYPNSYKRNVRSTEYHNY